MQGEIRSGLKEAFALALGIAGVLVVVTFPYLLNAYAYYRDDMQAQFAPMYSGLPADDGLQCPAQGGLRQRPL